MARKKTHQCDNIGQEEDSLYRAFTIYMKKVTILSDDN